MEELIKLFMYWPLTIILATVFIVLGETLINFKRSYMTFTALAGLLMALIMTYLPYLDNFQPIFIGGTGYNSSQVVIDKFTLFFTTIFIIAALYTIITGYNKLQEAPEDYGSGIFLVLVLLATTGMTLVSASADLLTLFVTWELLALPGYALVAFYTREKLSLEAAFKYFLLGGASAGLLLFGMSILYGFSGQSNIYAIFDAIATTTDDENAFFLILGLVAIIAGIGFEIGIVPFHWWIPDTYEGTSTAIAQLLTIGSKKAGFGAIFRVLLIPLFMVSNLATASAETQQVIAVAQLVIAIAAIVTMTVGNVAALKQQNLVRLLAYSSIAQAGYIMIAVAVAIAPPDVQILGTGVGELGLFGGLLHILSHTIMKGGAFAVVTVLLITGGLKTVDDLTGLSKESRWLAFALGVIVLSLAGIPPLFGFWSKAFLFISAVFGGLWWLALAGLLNSAISLFYYARIVKAMYIDKPEEVETTEKISEVQFGKTPIYYWLPIGATVIALIGIGLFPTFFFAEVFKVAEAVLTVFV
ncbi:MAG: NADH-quinone oxidoreductase subunit N [Candidatus Odinarchaeota archaeon]